MESHQLDELLTRLGDPDGVKRQRARETLAAIGEVAVPPLVGLLGNSDSHLRWEAAKALTEIPDPAAVPGLVSLLGDPKSEIRWLAAAGLIGLGNRSIPHVLRALTDHADSKDFRAASHHVFHDLAERNSVLREILEPVLAVLGDIDPAGVISTRAEVALRELLALKHRQAPE